MSDRELGALTTLGFDELREAAGGIGAIQQAISGRVFRAVGPGAALVRPVHDGDHARRLRGLGLGTRALGVAAGTAAERHAARRRAAGRPVALPPRRARGPR